MIDDDRDDFDLITEAIHDINPEVSVFFLDRCEDGIHYKDYHFDMIFLDINMPFHDGFSWLKGLRESGCSFPIIMYTNSSNPAHVVKAYEEGATLYFPKPESFRTLLDGIRKLLDLDWADPFSIKNIYSQNGHYTTFKVA